MPGSVIIVAGGAGSRMHSLVPKQFLPLAGKPVLMHTLEAFHAFRSDLQIVLVLPAGQISYWQDLCSSRPGFAVPHSIVAGGETRFHSVRNGLAAATGALTAVHDGVRPLVSTATLERCFRAAAEYGAAIPVIEPVDSIRCLAQGGSRSVDRSAYRLVQTPQVFRTSLLKEAYLQEYTPAFTDDASVVEAMGQTIHLVEGNRENLKITTPSDMAVAEALLSRRESR